MKNVDKLLAGFVEQTSYLIYYEILPKIKVLMSRILLDKYILKNFYA
jgi:hypothetical protein